MTTSETENQNRPDTPTLGAAIVGAGVIFRAHASAYKMLEPRVRLVGISDLQESRLANAAAQFFAPVCCTDYKELLGRDDIQIVSVCTPPAYHEQVVIDALEAGKFVICEKPLANNLASADRILEVAERHPRKLAVMYQNRYDPQFKKMTWLNNNGHLGTPLFGHCIRFSSLSGTSGAKGGWWGNWSNAGGGVVMTQFIHHLDQVCQLFGTPKRVSANLDCLFRDIESEDTFSATISFGDNTHVNCTATVAAQQYGYRLSMVGSEATVHIPWNLQTGNKGQAKRLSKMLNKQFPKPKLLDRNQKPFSLIRKVLQRLKFLTPLPNLHYHFIEECLDAIQNDREPPCPGIEGRQSLELCLAIYASGIEGRPINLPLGPEFKYYEGITAEDFKNRNLSHVTN